MGMVVQLSRRRRRCVVLRGARRTAQYSTVALRGRLRRGRYAPTFETSARGRPAAWDTRLARHVMLRLTAARAKVSARAARDPCTVRLIIYIVSARHRQQDCTHCSGENGIVEQVLDNAMPFSLGESPPSIGPATLPTACRQPVGNEACTRCRHRPAGCALRDSLNIRGHSTVVYCSVAARGSIYSPPSRDTAPLCKHPYALRSIHV